MEFLETYGLPSKLGKYPAGATAEEKMTLMRAVMSIGRNAGGIVPQGMSIDFNDATDGDTNNHMNWSNGVNKPSPKLLWVARCCHKRMARPAPMRKVKPMKISLM